MEHEISKSKDAGDIEDHLREEKQIDTLHSNNGTELEKSGSNIVLVRLSKRDVL